MLAQVLGYSPDLGNEQIQGVMAEKDRRGFIKIIHRFDAYGRGEITSYEIRPKPKRIRKPALQLLVVLQDFYFQFFNFVMKRLHVFFYFSIKYAH